MVDDKTVSNKRGLLSSINFGQRVAEDESDVLASYFVETDHWRKLYAGEIDIVYGPKGSGKSALYSLLNSKRDQFRARNIILAPAENPRGATVFRDLLIDPPASVREFIGLWKLYFACVFYSIFSEYDIKTPSANELSEVLTSEKLVHGKMSLKAMLQSATEYVRGIMRPQAIEASMGTDPVTQLPKITGKIIFSEPTTSANEAGFTSVDRLLDLANKALGESNLQVWILLDRLDVAFAENIELEQNALSALFRVYLDMAGFTNIRLKIFLRTDIWNRLTSGGFREASHITHHLTIEWNPSSLLNLVIRRILHNEAIVAAYKIEPSSVLETTKSQEELFYRLFPTQVEVGSRKSKTFEWLLGRTKDGTGKNAPRELIHILNSLRDIQVRRLEVGEAGLERENLFERAAFKAALSEVSKVRLEQTLYAEYPSLKPVIEKLARTKTLHTLNSLASIWMVSPDKASEYAKQLVEVGFFEQRGTREDLKYWVPFLYRDALDLVQGTAD